MKRDISFTLILAMLLAIVFMTSCVKERTDPPIVKKTYTTYTFMIEVVDNDGSTMYSEHSSIRKQSN